MAHVNIEHVIGQTQSVRQREQVGDDGSFINGAFPAVVVVIGSLPYGDCCDHAEQDSAHRVGLDDLEPANRAFLAVVLRTAEVGLVKA